MERNIRLNWDALVEEAKRRRKSQGLTQQHLAKVANVSTPTVSRFESGATDIILSSGIAILDVLGLIERNLLTFTEKSRVDHDRDVVEFSAVAPGDKRISCRISFEALQDHFQVSGYREQKLLKAFQDNQSIIQDVAQSKYRQSDVETDGSLLIRTGDIDRYL